MKTTAWLWKFFLVWCVVVTLFNGAMWWVKTLTRDEKPTTVGIDERAPGDNDDYAIPWSVWAEGQAVHAQLVDGAGNPVSASAVAIPPRAAVAETGGRLTVDLSQPGVWLPTLVNQSGMVILAADSNDNALAFLRSLKPGELATIYLKDGATGDYVALTLDDVREAKARSPVPTAVAPWLRGTSYLLEPIECQERRAAGESPTEVGGGCKSVGDVQECVAITPCDQPTP